MSSQDQADNFLATGNWLLMLSPNTMICAERFEVWHLWHDCNEPFIKLYKSILSCVLTISHMLVDTHAAWYFRAAGQFRQHHRKFKWRHFGKSILLFTACINVQKMLPQFVEIFAVQKAATWNSGFRRTYSYCRLVLQAMTYSMNTISTSPSTAPWHKKHSPEPHKLGTSASKITSDLPIARVATSTKQQIKHPIRINSHQMRRWSKVKGVLFCRPTSRHITMGPEWVWCTRGNVIGCLPIRPASSPDRAVLEKKLM